MEVAIEKYWREEAGLTELLVLMFFYFSAYLTGIGALLERLGAFCSCPAAEVALKVVYSILLVFYALVPVAGCAFFGIEVTKSTVDEDNGEHKEYGCPKDQTKEEYAEWLEEKSKDNPRFTIIAPFEKKYAWCVMEGIVLKT